MFNVRWDIKNALKLETETSGRCNRCFPQRLGKSEEPVIRSPIGRLPVPGWPLSFRVSDLWSQCWWVPNTTGISWHNCCLDSRSLDHLDISWPCWDAFLIFSHMIFRDSLIVIYQYRCFTQSLSWIILVNIIWQKTAMDHDEPSKHINHPHQSFHAQIAGTSMPKSSNWFCVKAEGWAMAGHTGECWAEEPGATRRKRGRFFLNHVF